MSDDREVEVDSAPERPSAIVLRDRHGGEVVVTHSELSRLLSMALDLQSLQAGVELHDPPYVRGEYELRRQNEQLRDRVRLVNKRLLQLETVLQGTFARTVKALSGDRSEAQQGADRAVRIIDDHTRALQLLRRAGIECDRVSAGVQRLLDERDRVIEVQAEPMEAERAVEIARFTMTLENRDRSLDRRLLELPAPSEDEKNE